MSGQGADKKPYQTIRMVWSFYIAARTFLKNGKVAMRPAEELKLLKTSSVEIGKHLVDGEHRLPVRGQMLEIDLAFDLSISTASSFGLHVLCSDDGQQRTLIRFDRNESCLFLDRDHSGECLDGVRRTALSGDIKVLRLHVFVDRSSVEVFANSGDVTMTSRVYPKNSSDRVTLFAENGTAVMTGGAVWYLKDKWSTTNDE
ncbi:GH32 C-terminal domain-containing protein [Bacillaceae bacterium Marseille-Q3522]|nr:GH32 C-terminal domain-containing protein [Bacillaceae bacterium Marseille-Q3522]